MFLNTEMVLIVGLSDPLLSWQDVQSLERWDQEVRTPTVYYPSKHLQGWIKLILASHYKLNEVWHVHKSHHKLCSESKCQSRTVCLRRPHGEVCHLWRKVTVKLRRSLASHMIVVDNVWGSSQIFWSFSPAVILPFCPKLLKWISHSNCNNTTNTPSSQYLQSPSNVPM